MLVHGQLAVAQSEQLCWSQLLPEQIIVVVSRHPHLAHHTVTLIVPGEVSVSVGDVAVDIKAESHRVGLVSGSDRVSEHVLIQGPVLAGADQSVRVAAPGNVSGHVSVLVEGGEGDEGSLDVPHVDSEVYAEGAAGEVVTPARSPPHSAHWSNGVDCVLQPMIPVSLLTHRVPNLKIIGAF